MNRINDACYRGNGTIPRGGVYAFYSTWCAKHGVIVLNPASFGKLIRAIFPNLPTRRLGVRGESRYHYTTFCVKEKYAIKAPPAPRKLSASNGTGKQRGTVADSSALKPQNQDHRISKRRDQRLRGYGVNAAAETENSADSDASQLVVEVPLALISEWPERLGVDEVHETFPDIVDYLPEGVSRNDAPAETLTALYTNHSLSLLRSMMVAKRSEFFRHYQTLSGTFTTPVQKLFFSPEVAPWIRKVDLITYQHMSRLVLWLSTQNLPKTCFDFFTAISERLVSHIQTTFSNAPPHVLEARIIPATIFANITSRCIEVNLSAHAVARPLADSETRDTMYQDFIRMLPIGKLVSGTVPPRAMKDLRDTIVAGIPAAIAPSDELLRADNSTFKAFAIPLSPENDSISRWIDLLFSLKERFPYASALEVKLYLQEVGSCVVDEMSSGNSFTTWYLLKTFVVKMFNLMCQTGGLIEMAGAADDDGAVDVEAATEAGDVPSVSEQQTASRKGTPETEASASFSIDMATAAASSGLPDDRAPFPQPTNGYAAGPATPSATNTHDDSAIGMMATPPADNNKGHPSGNDATVDDMML